jgi:C1A family cysteine protease
MNRFVAALATAGVASANLKDRSVYESKFYDWLQTHKVEVKSGADFTRMLQNFANNDDLIETTNAQNLSYKLGHNDFSHMSYEEWKVYMRFGLDIMPERETPTHVLYAPKDVSALPASVDWSTSTTGVVTPVKNQGNCGSCWSFSATGGLEGVYAQKYPQTASWTGFSEQELVSCNTKTDHGCNGGLMDRAFSYVERNGGLCSEASYPYTSGTTGQDGQCLDNTCTKDTKLALTGHTDVQTESDTALMTALASNPVSVAIQANQPAFQLYSSGVLTGTCGANLDHGVLAVGYGTYTDGTDYYKVKNSWGESWGMNGYVLIQRGANVNSGCGQCGILCGPPSFPNL